MSYNFKKIMDLELVNEVPEGANVLIETDGATKRLPSTAINSNIETPDWNQNDETAPDYVKNRTHYASVEIVDILPESEYAFEDKDGMMGTEFEGIIPIVSGETYQVTWNGVEYDCVCTELYGITLVGDASSVTSGGAFPSTGEPFIIGTMSTQNKSMIAALDGSTNATVSIRQEQETIHKLDKKYLPEVAAVKYVTVEKSDDNTMVADATYAQITEWINAGLEVKCIYGEYVMSLVFSYPELNGLAHAAMGNQYSFSCFRDGYERRLTIGNDDIYYNMMQYADHSLIPTVTTFYAGPIEGGVGRLYTNLALSNPVTKSELATANNSIIKVYNSADGSTHYPVSVCLNSTDPYGVVLIYRKNGSCDSLYTSEYTIAN